MYYYVTWVLFLSAVVQSSQNFEDNLVKRMVKECLVSRNAILCFANKAAKALERSMDWNVHFFDGVTFERNKEKAPESEARARTYGFGRLFKALNDFLNTHTLTLDLTKGETAVEARGGGGGGEGGGGGDEGGGFGGYKNAIKKEKKYMQYAFMVLLGIFGLTGPLMMKTLAIMAAKALLASKTALIIVGSVALKKIFEKDQEKTSVKVHTVSAHDGHDRIYIPTQSAPYWSYQPDSKHT